MSGFTAWLRSMQRSEADIRRDERERIAADMDRRAQELSRHLHEWSDARAADEVRTIANTLSNQAAALRSQDEPVRNECAP